MKTTNLNSATNVIGKLVFAVAVIVFSLLLNISGYSQGIGINATGVPAANSAMLDVSATNQGFLMPRVSLISNTDVTTVPNPDAYLMVFNTNASMTLGSGKGVYYWDAVASQWRPVGGGASPCSGAPAAPGTISGNVAVCTDGIGTYFVSPVSGATSYTWSYGGTGATVAGTGNIVVLSFSSTATSGNLSVTATNACGTSLSSPTLAVTVNGKPNSNFTPSTTTPLPGQSVTFTPADMTNQLYFWSAPGPPYSTATSPSLIWGTGLGTATLTVTKNGCNSTSTVTMGTAHGSATYSFSGSPQYFIVPSTGVTSVTLDVFGATGYSAWSSSQSALGGEAKGTLSVTPGQALNIFVGGSDCCNGHYTAAGEYGDGYGGDASSVRSPGLSLSDRIIVGGGGGGGSYNNSSYNKGGAGGGSTGANGVGGSASTTGGAGGSQSGGGAKGTGGTGTVYYGTDGGLGYGGTDNGWGGGGGGGYYGGGSGSRSSNNGSGSGGGGSNYLSPSLTSQTNSQGVGSINQNGKVIVTW